MAVTWACPVCRGDLSLVDGGRAWRCAANHSFDVAREGHVNLLITHQRRQREPGDNAEMIRNRRAFLDAGHYQPLRDALDEFATVGGDGRSACDAGCGEGYYTRHWSDLWGVDIGKTAVRFAAKRAAGDAAHYAIASAYDLPLSDGTIDVLLSVFAPLSSDEFERVVRPGGVVVTVTPGPDHLAGLAAELFGSVEPHPATGPFDGPTATTSLRHERSLSVRYDLTLDEPGAVGSLLRMTPYTWRVNPETAARVGELPRLETPVDFLVSVYRR